MTYICKHALTDDTISQIITIREASLEYDDEEPIDAQEGGRSHGLRVDGQDSRPVFV
jgi:hypothetical protein